MLNYISLNQITTRITKRTRLILFVISFAIIFWFYCAFRQPEIDDKNDFGGAKSFSYESSSNLMTEAKKLTKTTEPDTFSIKGPKDTRNILFWTKFFNDFSWTTGKTDEAGEEILKSVQCPVTNCFFTHNHKFLKKETDFDAILFHAPETMKPTLMPRERNDHQFYAMMSLESPLATHTNLNQFKNFFNLTVTYRHDSDITWDYGKIVDKETNEIVAPSLSPKWKEIDEDFYDEEMNEIVKNKTSPIAWFASNCVTNSYRKQFVKAISKIMPVDIYGRCGKLRCKTYAQECDDLLDAKYRFYLSFENALCRDYVTEKVFRQLDRFVIPVVYNGADTSLFAPPKSYIDANKFKDVKELTDYLQYLTDNPREYIKYFWWKKHYKIVQHPTYAYMLCDVCKKLNDPQFMSEKHQYESIDTWWSKKECTEPKIKFSKYL